MACATLGGPFLAWERVDISVSWSAEGLLGVAKHKLAAGSQLVLPWWLWTGMPVTPTISDKSLGSQC
jgi:hypothetical protein